MALKFKGVLADRSRWQVQDCSIELALDVVGTRSSLLILCEAFHGTTGSEFDYARSNPIEGPHTLLQRIPQCRRSAFVKLTLPEIKI